jgi:hypothetical protein
MEQSLGKGARLIKHINELSQLEMERRQHAPELPPLVSQYSREEAMDDFERKINDLQTARKSAIQMHMANVRQLKGLRRWETTNQAKMQQRKTEHLNEIAKLEARISQLRQERLNTAKGTSQQRLRGGSEPTVSTSESARVRRNIAWFKDYLQDNANTNSFQEYKAFRTDHKQRPLSQLGLFVETSKSIRVALRQVMRDYEDLLAENKRLQRIQKVKPQDVKLARMLRRTQADMSRNILVQQSLQQQWKDMRRK